MIKSTSRMILSALILVLLCHCTAERTVKDNRFYSSSPAISINIDKEFAYVASGSFQSTTYNADDPENKTGIGKADEKYYYFVSKAPDSQMVEKAVSVSIHEKRTSDKNWNWVNTFIDYDNDAVSDHGMVMRGNEYYEVATMAIKTTGSLFDKRLARKNLIAPNCMLCRVFVRKVDNKTYKMIQYFEDAKLLGFDCREWGKIKGLTDKRVKLIEDFNQRADKVVKIEAPKD